MGRDGGTFHALPKAEVHVHLEGCFKAATLESWAKAAGVPMPRPRETLFTFANLAEMLEFLDWACGLASTSDRVAELAYEFCQQLAADGTGYADLIINPTHWAAWHGRTLQLIEALDAGFAAAAQDGLPPVGLCISLLRTQSAAQSVELVENLIAWRHPRVVALSVDGNEATAGRTGPRFTEAYRRAAAAGLRRTVHAGESSGPEGVRDAIELLGAERIDHGVRAIEDERVVELLAERGIPLGVCPTSNLTLWLYSDIEAHPVDRLRRAGVRVSLNTDDPSLLATDLPAEYARAATAFAWSNETLREVAGTSIDASFADADVRAKLRAALASWQP